MFLATGSLLGGLTGSYTAAQAGVPWIHWTNVILSAVIFVLCLFFQPEMLFEHERAELRPTDDMDITSPGGKPSAVKTENLGPDSARNYAPYTFLRSLKIGTYRSGVVGKFLHAPATRCLACYVTVRRARRRDRINYRPFHSSNSTISLGL